MKYLWIISLFALIGCTQEEEVDEPTERDTHVQESDPYEGLSMKDAVELHIRRELSIPADEKIDYQIYEENCDGDAELDAVIIVNLLDRAVNNAIKSGKVAKHAELGFMGNFNYIIYRDGFSGAFSTAIPIPSSPKAKLTIEFESLRSDRQKDILVGYRILNAAYVNYFMVANGQPFQVNQVKLFDGMGTKDAVGYAVAYEPGEISNVKNIIVYEGTFKNPTFNAPDDVYTFDPEITKTQRMHEKWFFNPQDEKYYLMQE